MFFEGTIQKEIESTKSPYKEHCGNVILYKMSTELFCKISTMCAPPLCCAINAQQVSSGAISSHLRVFVLPCHSHHDTRYCVTLKVAREFSQGRPEAGEAHPAGLDLAEAVKRRARRLMRVFTWAVGVGEDGTN